jgi:hypothetical protein
VFQAAGVSVLALDRQELDEGSHGTRQRVAAYGHPYIGSHQTGGGTAAAVPLVRCSDM